ncbi:hypothetical protein D3C86_1341670 [compost metagenome]
MGHVYAQLYDGLSLFFVETAGGRHGQVPQCGAVGPVLRAVFLEQGPNLALCAVPSFSNRLRACLRIPYEGPLGRCRAPAAARYGRGAIVAALRALCRPAVVYGSDGSRGFALGELQYPSAAVLLELFYAERHLGSTEPDSPAVSVYEDARCRPQGV